MHCLGYYLGISKQTEVFILTLVGICATIFDESLLYLNSNLHKVWELVLDPKDFSGSSQMYIKYILSGIILVRSFTVHLYLAFYIVMLWPAIFEERPVLLLPWLMIGIVKSLLMSVVALTVGMYTCLVPHFYKAACFDFMLAQIVEHSPAFYMWLCVLSYYRELNTCTTILAPPAASLTYDDDEVILRRRKVRSLNESNDAIQFPRIDKDRDLITVSKIENIIQQLTMDMPKMSRSLDSLLVSMPSEKSVWMELCEETHSGDVTETLREKAVKFLKLTQTDIDNAKLSARKGCDQLFSESMLLICNLSDTISTFPTKTKLLTKHTETENNELKSQKKAASFANSKYLPRTEFMSEISEIEIYPPLNYSTISISTDSNNDKSKSAASLQTVSSETRSLIPLRVFDDNVFLSWNRKTNETRDNATTADKCEFEVISDMKKMRDFACQASTLSRNILAVPPVEFLQSLLSPLYQRKRQHGIVKNAKALKDKIVSTSENKEELKAQIKKKKLIFKADGYTVAYMTKMRNKNK